MRFIEIWLMCYRPLHISRPANGFLAFDVPCNKCAQCRDQKRLDYLFRNFVEAQHSLDKHFLTLTYNNRNLPYVNVFTDNPVFSPDGECLVPPVDKRISCWSKEHIHKFLKSLEEKCLRYVAKKRGIKRLVPDYFGNASIVIRKNSKGEYKSKLSYKRIVSPEWLDFVHDFTPFTYFCVCERGTKDRYNTKKGFRYGTKRPHYHLIFNMKSDEISSTKFRQFVRECWSYGWIYDETIDRSFPSVVNYITKYVTKQHQNPIYGAIYPKSYKCSKLVKEWSYELGTFVNKRISIWSLDFHRTECDVHPFISKSKCYGKQYLEVLKNLSPSEFLQKVTNGVQVSSASGKSITINLPQYYLRQITKEYIDKPKTTPYPVDRFVDTDFFSGPHYLEEIKHGFRLSHETKTTPIGEALTDVCQDYKRYRLINLLYDVQVGNVSHPQLRSGLSLDISDFADYLSKRNIVFDTAHFKVKKYEDWISDVHTYDINNWKSKKLDEEISYNLHYTDSKINQPATFNLVPL